MRKRVGRLFLIGPMGAGKTTIGKMLADDLGMEFCDADHEIEVRAGVDIPWIFDMEGEEGFRRREVSVLTELTEVENIVLSTGGGAIVDAENRKNLGARGLVIYLFTSVQEQLRRTARDRKRPLLSGDDADRESTLWTLMEARDPLYREIADITVDTDGRSPRSVVNELLQKIREPV